MLSNASFSVADLHEALRSAGVGIWVWDIATGVIRWSDVTYAIYEIDRDQFHGDFASFAARLHPEDRDWVTTTIADAVASARQDFSIEHRALMPGGALKWLAGRGRVVPSRDGTPTQMVGTVEDITARKLAEERLRKGEERLRLFTNHATDYVYEATLEGDVAVPEIVAGSFERTTGVSAEEIKRRGGWLNFIHPDDRMKFQQGVSELHRGRSVLNEYRIVDANGRVRWLRDRAVPVEMAEGGVRRMFGGVSDITEQRALEERLLEAQRMEALARLAAGVAHDFNNLLTVLMAETAFLRAPRATPDARQNSLDQIDATLERAAYLTSSLLAFGRKRVGPTVVIDVAAKVADAWPMLARAAGEKVTVHVDARAPVRVTADPSDIHLVLLNLTLNARDAMPLGGRVFITIDSVTFGAAEPVRPDGLPAGRYARIRIADEGAGMTEEAANRIFEPYFTTKGHGGTGLGLPTALMVAKRYGGLLRLRETGRKGSVFELLLPVSDGDPSEKDVAKDPPVGGNEHILCVEDDAAVRSVTARILETHGYRVTCCGSAEEALASDVRDIDALVTDVRLPGESGLELAVKLRARKPSLRVLVVSGHVEDQRQQAQLAQGAFAFLPKPYAMATLCERLREVLEDRP